MASPSTPSIEAYRQPDQRPTELEFFYKAQNLTGRTRPIVSPYVEHAGFLWRLLLYPRRWAEADYVSAYIQCGGPGTGDVSSKTSSGSRARKPSHHQQQHHKDWICSVHFRIELVHPSKWPSLVAPDIAEGMFSNRQHVVSDLRELSKEGNSTHKHRPERVRKAWKESKTPRNCPNILRQTDHAFCPQQDDWGFSMFTPTRMLRPGMHADDLLNIIVKVRIRIKDTRVSASMDTDARSSRRRQPHAQMSLAELLDTRAKLVSHIADYDEKLSHARSEAAKNTLEAERTQLSAALAALPAVVDSL